jgi:hypothetical protein
MRPLRRLADDHDLFAVVVVLWILTLATVGIVVAFAVTITSETYHFDQMMSDLKRQGNWIVAAAIVVAARVLKPFGNGVAARRDPSSPTTTAVAIPSHYRLEDQMETTEQQPVEPAEPDQPVAPAEPGTDPQPDDPGREPPETPQSEPPGQAGRPERRE